MPVVHTAKTITKRLGDIIKNVEKVKNEEGIFDNLNQEVRKLEQKVQHKVDSMENKKAIEKKKVAEKKRIADEEKAAREEQARLDELVEQEARRIEEEAESQETDPVEDEAEDK